MHRGTWCRVSSLAAMAHLAKSTFWFVFVNKVLIAHSQALLLLLSMTVCTTAPNLSYCHKDRMACEIENSYSLALYRKCLMTPGLELCYPVQWLLTTCHFHIYINKNLIKFKIPFPSCTSLLSSVG